MLLAKAGLLVPSRDMVVQNRDGAEVWLNVTNIPVPLEIGGLSTVVHIFREANGGRQMEQMIGRLSSIVRQLAASQARQPKHSYTAAAHHQPLTPREQQVLRLLAEGANAPSIATTLVLSPTTARKHIQNILKKLNVHTTLEAVAYSSRHNLVNSSTP